MNHVELIAEMADALYTMVPSCFCHAKHCSQCENWERAKKLVDTAGVFAADLKSLRGSAGKKPPQGGSVNTPRPPQDTTAGEIGAKPLQELLDRIPIWQDGPAKNGTIPESVPDKIITYAVVKIVSENEFALLYFGDAIGRWVDIEDQSVFDSWVWVEKWLILK